MTNFWAAQLEFLNEYRSFQAGWKVDAAAVKNAVEMLSQSSSISRIEKKVAIIEILGILSDRFEYSLFIQTGAITLYSDIIEQLNTAEGDPDVEYVLLKISSVGGRLRGLFEVLDRISTFSKPIESLVDIAHSAAFAIAAQTDHITLQNEASNVGSIGIVVNIPINEDIVTLSSAEAPDKSPDVRSQAGAMVIRKELDAVHETFVQRIAQGRSAATGAAISPQFVNANFGRGGTLLAEAALTVQMIDAITPAPSRISNSLFFATDDNNRHANSDNNLSVSALNSLPQKSKKFSASKFQNKISEKIMDIQTFKREHPDIYDQVFAAGEKSGRENSAALLNVAKDCGKVDFALECIKSGKSIGDAEVTSEILKANLNKNDVEARKRDNPDSFVPPKEKTEKEKEKTEVDAYVQRYKTKAGVN